MKARMWFLVAVVAALLGLAAGSGAAFSASWQVAGVSPQDNDWVNGCGGPPLDWDNEQIGSAAFWREGITGGDAQSRVLVAVIDSGVEGAHEAFRLPDGSSRVLPGRDFDLNRDCGGLEWDPASGHYRLKEPYDTRDCDGHGTHVAGIVAADAHTSHGPIRGVAPGTSILPLKVFYLRIPDADGWRWSWPGQLIEPHQTWEKTITVPPGAAVIDFTVTWTNASRNLDMAIRSPLRDFVGEDNLESPGTSEIKWHIPVQHEWGEKRTWTVRVTGNFDSGAEYFDVGISAYRWDARPEVIAAAIDDAVAEQAKVINLSFGWWPYTQGEELVQAAIQDAVQADVTVVAAAGNDGCFDQPFSINFPGTLIDVITVGANALDGQRSAFSSMGPTPDDNAYTKPDVLAPGGQEDCNSGEYSDHVCSTMSHDILDDWYAFPYVGLTGTSMATPQVSGLAALLIQYYQVYFPQHELRPLEVKALLQGTAVNPDGSPNTGPKDNAVGAGRVSAGRALVAFPSHLSVPPYPAEATLQVWVPDELPGPSSPVPLKATACWNDLFYGLILSHDDYGGCDFRDKTYWCVQDPATPTGHTFRVLGIYNSTPVDVYLASTYPPLSYLHNRLDVPRMNIASWRVYRFKPIVPENSTVHTLVYWNRLNPWNQPSVVNARLFKGTMEYHESWYCNYALRQVLNCTGSSAYAGDDWWIGLQNLSGPDDVPVSIMSNYQLARDNAGNYIFEDWPGVARDAFLPLLFKNKAGGAGGMEVTPMPVPTPGWTPYPVPPTPTPGGPTPAPTPTPSGDRERPVSSMAPLSPFHNTATFPVSWSGYDTGGSGLRGYDVQWVILPKTSPWINWLDLTPATTVTFTWGQDGFTYGFRCRAVDNAWNSEAFPYDPEVTTTVDLTAPSSQAGPLPPFSPATFSVSWSGSDATSGIQDYDLQVCQADCGLQAKWSDWLTGTMATSASFTGEHAQTYRFRSRARDRAGNEELYPDGGDTWTVVDAHPPSTTVEPLDLYTFTTSFTVRWHGADDLSGLDHYDIYYRDESQAGWVLWQEDVTSTRATFLGTPGHTYHFCSRGVDNAGNAENCPPACVEGDQCGWPIQGDAQIGIVPWSRVDDLPPYTAQTTFPVCWSGIDEQWYDVYVRDGLYGGWAKWKKDTLLTCGSYAGAYGHVYYFYSVGKSEQGAEQAPYDWDAYTKLVAPTEGEGAAGGGALVLPPDEAPDRMEDVTRTQTIGTLLSGTIAPQGDVDWYRFELSETLRLRARLYDLPADYDLYVFDGSGQFLWASTWGRRLPEEVVVRVPAGVYYVRLAGYAGAWNGDVPYRLLIEPVGTGP